MTPTPFPPRSAEWLTAVAARLDRLDARERDEIVDGLRAHILDALDAGEREDDVLTGLGMPEDVAASALHDTAATAPPAPSPPRRRPRARATGTPSASCS